jgi:hypothetical protein
MISTRSLLMRTLVIVTSVLMLLLGTTLPGHPHPPSLFKLPISISSLTQAILAAW